MNKKKVKNIVILGASSDIGSYVTERFLSLGFNVKAHYFNNKNKMMKISQINKNRLDLFKFDLRNIYKWEKFLKNNKRIFLNTDIFISLTGFLEKSKFDKFDLKNFYNHLNVNYLSSIIITRYFLPNMIKNKFGRILYTSSIGTKFGGGMETFCYSSSKFCNEFFPNYLRKLSRFNVIANTLQIGVTQTKIHNKLKNKNLKKRVKLIPIGRMAKISEVGDFIIDLVQKNNLISSKVINISGGE